MAAALRRPTLDDQARAALPLTPIALHILLALVDRHRHGLGIAQHVEEFTGGRITLGPGTLYGTIKRLLELELIDDAESNPDEEAVDPRRRYYHITALGRPRARDRSARAGERARRRPAETSHPMKTKADSLAEHAYRALVRLHPRAFRERFGDELLDFVHVRRRALSNDGTRVAFAFWIRALLDVFRSLVRERVRAWAGVRTVFAGSAANVRDGLRFVRRSPGVSVTIILLMAVTIGAASSVFSVVNAVLLRPLPFGDPERLVMVWEARPDRSIERNPVSGHEFPVWSEANRTFERMAAIAFYGGLTLTGAGEPKAVTGVRVTSDFFGVLGLTPLLGRGFVPQEDVPGQGQVLVLSERLWRERFGADPGAIGRTAVLDGKPYEIVGVLGDGLTFPGFWYSANRSTTGLRSQSLSGRSAGATT